MSHQAENDPDSVFKSNLLKCESESSVHRGFSDR